MSSTHAVPDVRIAFLGQCHTIGYAAVPPDSMFPEVCRRVLQASRPGRNIEFFADPYYQPAQLMAATKNALLRRPHVVVIEIVGWMTIAESGEIDLARLPRGVRTGYQRAQHMRRAVRIVKERAANFGGDLLLGAQHGALAAASAILRPLLPRVPAPTVGEYEHAATRALALIAEHSRASIVIQGPGALNMGLDSKKIASDALQRYRAVLAMARRLAAAHNALFVDRWDTVAGNFYLPGSARPTTSGHSVWGHLLADELLRAGVV